MFFPKSRALEMLEDIKHHVSPGGSAIVNVLIEGTTYLDMFEPGHSYLFARGELQERFVGWELLQSRDENFEAPGPSVKAFTTVIARKAERVA
jgi:tellurite methyltransferase